MLSRCCALVQVQGNVVQGEAHLHQGVFFAGLADLHAHYLLIAQLVVDYTDGTATTVVSDTSWKVHDGPIQRNSIFLGEVYDAREEISGWNRAGLATAAVTRRQAAVAEELSIQIDGPPS